MTRPVALVVLALALALAPPAAAAPAHGHDGPHVPTAFPGLLGALPGADEGPVDLVVRNHEVAELFDALEAQHPRYFAHGVHGASTMGYPIHDGTITDTEAAEPKFHVYLDGGHHGNEFLGNELVLQYVAHLMEGVAAEDPDVLEFLREYVVYVTPIVNPDGNYLDTRKNGNQVDVNRNYPYEWGLDGASDKPWDFNYHGTEPLSEPETRANVEFASARDLDLWVTMHTGVAEMYWPWSYTNDDPPDAALFYAMEEPFEAAAHGRLDAMQSAELYIADGDTEDFGYGVLGVPSFVIEVHEDQFTPAYAGEIPSVIAEQFDGLRWLVENTPLIGARVHVHEHEPAVGPAVSEKGGDVTFWLHNKGWGEASGVTLALARDGATIATKTLDLAPGAHANVTFEDAGDLEGLRLDATYPRLLVDSTKTLTFAWPAAEAVAASSGGPLDVPAPGLAGALVAFAVAFAAFRRSA